MIVEAARAAPQKFSKLALHGGIVIAVYENASRSLIVRLEDVLEICAGVEEEPFNAMRGA